jgi:DNA-binding MarR family transcriptional regulator
MSNAVQDREPGSEDPEAEIALITRAVMRLGRDLRRATPPDGADGAVLALLIILHRDGAMPAVALADAQGLQPQSLSRVIARMEDHALIERTPDPADRRNKLIAITDKGRRALGYTMQHRRAWLASRIAERLSGDERETLVEASELMLRIAL